MRDQTSIFIDRVSYFSANSCAPLSWGAPARALAMRWLSKVPRPEPDPGYSRVDMVWFSGRNRLKNVNFLPKRRSSPILPDVFSKLVWSDEFSTSTLARARPFPAPAAKRSQAAGDSDERCAHVHESSCESLCAHSPINEFKNLRPDHHDICFGKSLGSRDQVGVATEPGPTRQPGGGQPLRRRPAFAMMQLPRPTAPLCQASGTNRAASVNKSTAA